MNNIKTKKQCFFVIFALQVLAEKYATEQLIKKSIFFLHVCTRQIRITAQYLVFP